MRHFAQTLGSSLICASPDSDREREIFHSALPIPALLLLGDDVGEEWGPSLILLLDT